MEQVKKKTQGDIAGLGVLSIPNVMLEVAEIPPDSNPIVEILPDVLLIGVEQPLWQTDRPYLRLFDDLDIEPKEATTTLEKGGYFDK